MCGMCVWLYPDWAVMKRLVARATRKIRISVTAESWTIIMVPLACVTAWSWSTTRHINVYLVSIWREASIASVDSNIRKVWLGKPRTTISRENIGNSGITYRTKAWPSHFSVIYLGLGRNVILTTSSPIRFLRKWHSKTDTSMLLTNAVRAESPSNDILGSPK